MLSRRGPWVDAAGSAAGGAIHQIGQEGLVCGRRRIAP